MDSHLAVFLPTVGSLVCLGVSLAGLSSSGHAATVPTPSGVGLVAVKPDPDARAPPLLDETAQQELPIVLPLLWVASFTLPGLGSFAALVLALVWSVLHVKRDDLSLPHRVRVQGVSSLVHVLLALCWLGALYQLASFIELQVNDVDSTVLY